jgi:threonyl-tRNA synthetase
MAVKINEFGPLETMRHSAAHVLAAAIMKLFPEAKLGVGPVIENGFYYDVMVNRAITPDDFKDIEREVYRIINSKVAMKREEMSIDDAIAFFAARKQDFKVELLKDLKTRGTTAVAEDEAGDVDSAKPDTASVYYTGDFVDLCRGPHVGNTSEIGAVKIDKVASAYWRGKAENPQLQRIYGLAFKTKEDLQAYEKLLEEAKKRDHRKLGKELGLFVFSDLVGPGLPLWTPKGTVVRDLLNDFVWALRKRHGYMRVAIPHITKKDLYETSGHWAKYADDLFKIQTRDGHTFAMKPMNCPHHTQIYASEPRSYRELPVRYAETTMVYRDEQTGELSGLSRVLSITQDDAHVFCRQSQVRSEAEIVWDIIQTFYKAFGFTLTPRLSRRDPLKADKYMGKVEDWDKAEAALREILVEKKVEWVDGPGEAAFYGPKIDFMAKDALGRVWQVATIQLDFNQPNNFDLTCVNEKSEKERILMIHCAIMGSIERFMSILIEHFAGAFPNWLAPVQVKVLAVGESHRPFAEKLARELVDLGIRAEADVSDETVGKKVRHAEGMKIPYMLVVGDKEAGGGALAVRTRGSRDMVEMEKSAFVAMVEADTKERK